jgi:hypothetical protein
MLKSPSARRLARILARQSVAYALAGVSLPLGGYWTSPGIKGPAALRHGARLRGGSRALLTTMLNGGPELTRDEPGGEE